MKQGQNYEPPAHGNAGVKPAQGTRVAVTRYSIPPASRKYSRGVAPLGYGEVSGVKFEVQRAIPFEIRYSSSWPTNACVGIPGRAPIIGSSPPLLNERVGEMPMVPISSPLRNAYIVPPLRT